MRLPNWLKVYIRQHTRITLAWRIQGCCLRFALRSRRPVPGDIIIFHPDRRIFGLATEDQSGPLGKAILENPVSKAMLAFIGFDDDVFIKRIVAVGGDTVEVLLSHKPGPKQHRVCCMLGRCVLPWSSLCACAVYDLPGPTGEERPAVCEWRATVREVYQ